MKPSLRNRIALAALAAVVGCFLLSPCLPPVDAADSLPDGEFTSGPMLQKMLDGPRADLDEIVFAERGARSGRHHKLQRA